MRKLLWLFAGVVLTSCGNSGFQISQPLDGQSFSIDRTQSIIVTMNNNDYSGVTIQFTGDTQRIPDFNWTPVQGSQAVVSKGYGGQTGGYGGYNSSATCTQQSPCTVRIIATRGNDSDTRTIQLYH